MVNINVVLIAAAADFVLVARYGPNLRIVMRDGMSTLAATLMARELCTTEERDAVREHFAAPRLSEEPCPVAAWSAVPEVVTPDWAR